MADEFDPWLDPDDKNNQIPGHSQQPYTVGGRQAGKTLRQPSVSRPAFRFTLKQDVERISGLMYQELRMIKPEYLDVGTVIRWISRGQGPTARPYTYAGVWTGGLWFITGTGQFYGANQFTHELFIEHVLGHSDVAEIQLSSEWLAGA